MIDKVAVLKAALANRKKSKGKKVAPATDSGTPVYESENGEAAAAKSGKKPSAGISKSKKSSAVKSAKKGTDFGKKNVPGKTGFSAVEQNAEKEGMDKASAQKVAGAAFWKKLKPRRA